MKKFVVLNKKVGETPLECMEKWREAQPPAYKTTSLTYAGRLDPMASGKLLVLIGEECKKKDEYLGLDKEYEFSVLLGASSDTGDVLGLVTTQSTTDFSKAKIRHASNQLIGQISLPYPKFSSKTVNGKPLHTWTIENRLHEITIPTKTSTIYKLSLLKLETIKAAELYKAVSYKIETIPTVTEKRKALGNDFRRPDIRDSWKKFLATNTDKDFQIATFRCTASSGTYMRTLAEVLAKQLGTTGLAYSIHRTKIGRYQPILPKIGLWLKTYK